jgi:hypothetical protein
MDKSCLIVCLHRLNFSDHKRDALVTLGKNFLIDAYMNTKSKEDGKELIL